MLVEGAFVSDGKEYPSKFVFFTEEQSMQIELAAPTIHSAEFVTDCINQAIAEGDCSEGTVETPDEDPAKAIKWVLLR